MITIAVMCAGILAGKFLFPEKFRKGNEFFQTFCTAFLIFAMGVTLGRKEDLFDDLLSLGLDSLLFFALPTTASIFTVVFLTRSFPGQKREAGQAFRRGMDKKEPAGKGGPDLTVLIALLALFSGALCGASGAARRPLSLLTSHKDLILYLLMFSVGISIGLHHGLIRSIRQYHLRIFILPAGIILGSLLGGAVCGLITGRSVFEGAAVAGGLGWYSLAGVTLENLIGVQTGSVAFLSNLMRELFSFFSIPFVSRKNYYACIAAAGATSEDTTLPLMIRYTNEETVILSVLNGAICSAFVPVLLSLCCWLSGR